MPADITCSLRDVLGFGLANQAVTVRFAGEPELADDDGVLIHGGAQYEATAFTDTDGQAVLEAVPLSAEWTPPRDYELRVLDQVVRFTHTEPTTVAAIIAAAS